MAESEDKQSQSNVVQGRGLREWTDDEMIKMVEKIFLGYTYRDVTDGTHVPMSTLWTRVKSKYGGQIRPKTGSPGIFPHKLESDLALFLKHCDLLRIPRTRQHFKDDIRHYVQYNNLTFKRLTEDGPGRTWMDRFALDWKELVDFKMKGVVFNIRNDPITMRSWVTERDGYTRIQIFTKLFMSRKYIFVIELKELEIVASNTVKFPVMITYNADGDILPVFVAHSENIPQAVQDAMKELVVFCQTVTGQFDADSLIQMIKEIHRFLADRELYDSPIVYLSPLVSNCFGYTLWDLCNQYQFVIQTVPQNIYNYLRTANLGFFEKFDKKMKEEVRKQFPQATGHCFIYNFLDIISSVIKTAKLACHLRNSCRHLRIVTVVPEIESGVEEIDIIIITYHESIKFSTLHTQHQETSM